MKTKLSLFNLLFIFCSLTATSQAQTDEVPDDIVIIQNGRLEFQDDGKVFFQVKVHEGFFAYLDKFKLEIDGQKVSGLNFDPVVTFFDKTFNKNKNGVKNDALAKATISISEKYNAGDQINITLSYQACTPEYCLFPTDVSYKQTLSEPEAKILSKLSQPDWLKGGLFYALLFVFLTGLLTSLTPCVYPLIPITLAVLGSEKADSKLKGFSKSLVYVLGMALTYSGLGMLAVTSGFMFGSLLSNIYFVGFLSLVLFLAALSMLDVFEIKSPAFLNKFNGGKKKSLLGIFISGAFSGLIVGPCVGPVLVGILSYVSTSGDLFKGFIFLFTFAIGLGSLIIVLGTFSSLLEKIPKSGGWMVWIKKALGLVFILMIGYFLKPILSDQNLILAISIIFLCISLIMIWHFKKSETAYASSIEKAFFMSILIFSILISLVVLSLSTERFERLVGYSSSTYMNTQWDVFSEEKLHQAKENGQIVILDFYADWCAACKELKHITFADKKVLNYSDKIKWLYFDSTKPSQKLTEYKNKYKIMGLPTVLIFDSSGNLRKDLSLTGFESPGKFLIRLGKLNLKNGEPND